LFLFSVLQFCVRWWEDLEDPVNDKFLHPVYWAWSWQNPDSFCYKLQVGVPYPMIYNRWPCKLKAQLGGSSTKLRPILVLVFLDLRNTFILAVMWGIWEVEVGLFWSFESKVPGYSVSVSVKWGRNIISLSDWRLIMQSIDYELYELSVSLRQTLCTWCKLVVCL
jgi:hypothetical protein